LVLTQPGDFAYHTLDGEEQHLLASKGKVLFVNRWGTLFAATFPKIVGPSHPTDEHREPRRPNHCRS
jgi:hypothetical protein